MIRCTVAIPVYNRKDMIDSTLRSVLEQDCPDLEILLIDDNSEDGVWERIQSYRDPRLRLIHNNTNIGLFANFNKGLNLAKGKYVRILCNDDKLKSGCIKRECDFMDAHSNVALLNTSARIVNSSNELLCHTGRDMPEGIYNGHEAIRMALQYFALYRNPFSCPSSVIIKTSVIRTFNLMFDESMKMSGDLLFFLNILEHGDLSVSHMEGAIVKVHTGSAGFKQKLSSTPLIESIDITKKYLYLFNKSERHDLLTKLAGRRYIYAIVLYLRGYRSEAKDMFCIINKLSINRSMCVKSAFMYLTREIYIRIDRIYSTPTHQEL